MNEIIKYVVPDQPRGRLGWVGRSEIRDRAYRVLSRSPLRMEDSDATYCVGKQVSKLGAAWKGKVRENDNISTRAQPRIRSITKAVRALFSFASRGQPKGTVKQNLFKSRRLEQNERDVVPFPSAGKRSEPQSIELRTDVKKIREKTGLSQQEFSEAFGIPLATLRNWEQGRRKPDVTVCLLLNLIGNDPVGIAEEVKKLRIKPALFS